MVMGPDAVAESTVAGFDCSVTAAPEDKLCADETVSSVDALSHDDDVDDVVDQVIVKGIVLIGLEVVRPITCR